MKYNVLDSAEMHKYYTTGRLQDIHTKKARAHARFCCVQNTIECMFTAGITDIAQQFQICHRCHIYRSYNKASHAISSN